MPDELPLGGAAGVELVGTVGATLEPALRVVPIVAVRAAGEGFSTMRIGSLSAGSVAMDDVVGAGVAAETESRPLAELVDAAGAGAAPA